MLSITIILKYIIRLANIMQQTEVFTAMLCWCNEIKMKFLVSWFLHVANFHHCMAHGCASHIQI